MVRRWLTTGMTILALSFFVAACDKDKNGGAGNGGGGTGGGNGPGRGNGGGPAANGDCSEAMVTDLKTLMTNSNAAPGDRAVFHRECNVFFAKYSPTLVCTIPSMDGATFKASALKEDCDRN